MSARGCGFLRSGGLSLRFLYFYQDLVFAKVRPQFMNGLSKRFGARVGLSLQRCRVQAKHGGRHLIEGKCEFLVNLKRGDELTTMLESARRRLEGRTRRQQCLDFCSKCCIVLHAVFESGLPGAVIFVRLFDIGMIAWLIRLALGRSVAG